MATVSQNFADSAVVRNISVFFVLSTQNKCYNDKVLVVEDLLMSSLS